jgi:hypothetical protein
VTEKNFAIKIVREDKLAKVILPLNSKGRIRFKLRHSSYKIGQQIKREDIDINNKDQYIEWQITYSIKAKDTDSNNLLVDCKYRDLGNQDRYPYELGTILLELKKAGIITKQSLELLKNEISTYTLFLDNENVLTSDVETRTINNITFNFIYWNIPLFICNNPDGTFIEVLKEKQQYAYQMQPMVYFCIPCPLLKKNPANSNEVLYIIKPENKDSIINLFRVFGCVSIKHHHDIVEILNCILKLP